MAWCSPCQKTYLRNLRPWPRRLRLLCGRKWSQSHGSLLQETLEHSFCLWYWKLQVCSRLCKLRVILTLGRLAIRAPQLCHKMSPLIWLRTPTPILWFAGTGTCFTSSMQTRSGVLTTAASLPPILSSCKFKEILMNWLRLNDCILPCPPSSRACYRRIYIRSEWLIKRSWNLRYLPEYLNEWLIDEG